MKNDCLFCAIAAGEIPSNKVYEDDLCYAFYDIAPQAPTHFLVIPKEHIGSVAEIGELARTDEDVLTYAMFPGIAPDFLRAKYGG